MRGAGGGGVRYPAYICGIGELPLPAAATIGDEDEARGCPRTDLHLRQNDTPAMDLTVIPLPPSGARPNIVEHALGYEAQDLALCGVNVAVRP